jgi:hypothetical protein
MVKSKVLSALNQFADSGMLEDVPTVNSEDDFELYKMGSSRYAALDASKGVRDQKLTTWTTLYIRFRDQSGEFSIRSRLWRVWSQVTVPVPVPVPPWLNWLSNELTRHLTPVGNLQDVEVTEPGIDDDEDPQPQSQSQSQSQSDASAKGKGRA